MEISQSLLEKEGAVQVSCLETNDVYAQEVNLKEYNFPFENLVFEGGGIQAVAYCGAMEILEECGIFPQIKRFSGSSAGAIHAAFVAVGLTSDEVKRHYNRNMAKNFWDSGCCRFLPNLIFGYGLNTGKKFEKHFKRIIREKTGNGDITFREVYERYGKELCIVITNVNRMNTEYCHPKTTPDMPIRLAVRMSMSIPGYFQTVRYKHDGFIDTYADGGVLCSYPIHCFDGWYLSMKPEDCFMKRLHSLSKCSSVFDIRNRFSKFNDKSLGFILYSDNEETFIDHQASNRPKVVPADIPITPLSRTKKKVPIRNEKTRPSSHIVEAADAFFTVLNKYSQDEYGVISEEELEAAFADEETFPREHAELLFGFNTTYKTAFTMLTKNQKIGYEDLLQFFDSLGMNLNRECLGHSRLRTDNFVQFVLALQTTLRKNVEYLYLKEEDIDRTVGIHVGYIDVIDFEVEEADQEYLYQQGRMHTIAFMNDYIVKNGLTKKLKLPKSKIISEAEPLPPASVHISSRVKNVFQNGIDGQAIIHLSEIEEWDV